MMDQSNTLSREAGRSTVNIRTEIFAGLSTYLTMSYIFLLNPALLSKAGIDTTAAFISTILTAFLATLAMGIYARLPYAVAPVPTVTTFFVFYVCKKMHIPWQDGLFAVFLSGILSVGATVLSVRQRLIANMPGGLKVSIMFAIGGFLVANGLNLAGIVTFGPGGLLGGGVQVSSISCAAFTSNKAIIAVAGLAIATILNYKMFRFKAGPLFALIASALIADRLGFPMKHNSVNFEKAFASFGQIRASAAWAPTIMVRFWLSTFVFFLVDFYGAIGKFVGLFELTKESVRANEDKVIGRALMVDSVGTILGSLVGTSSAAVFISSAVGVMSGGRTMVTAVSCAMFIILSGAFIPLAGTIPTVVSSGILIYVGVMLIPWSSILPMTGKRIPDLVTPLLSGGVSIVSYGVDKGLLVGFAAYSVMLLFDKAKRTGGAAIYLYITTALLGASVTVQGLFA